MTNATLRCASAILDGVRRSDDVVGDEGPSCRQGHQGIIVRVGPITSSWVTILAGAYAAPIVVGAGLAIPTKRGAIFLLIAAAIVRHMTVARTVLDRAR